LRDSIEVARQIGHSQSRQRKTAKSRPVASSFSIDHIIHNILSVVEDNWHSVSPEQL
jgi:hypothetical protein